MWRLILGVSVGMLAGLSYEGLLLYGCYRIHITLVPVMLFAQGLTLIFNYGAHKGE